MSEVLLNHSESYGLRCIASVACEDGSRYLRRLCKHFSHKVPASWGAHQGRVDFAMGTCLMRCCEQRLEFSCAAASEPELGEVVETITGHFERFAGDAGLELDWRRSTDNGFC